MRSNKTENAHKKREVVRSLAEESTKSAVAFAFSWSLAIPAASSRA